MRGSHKREKDREVLQARVAQDALQDAVRLVVGRRRFEHREVRAQELDVPAE
jgi:hypothetical protein